MVPTDDNALTGRVIGCAMEVHHHLGPGLLESFYEDGLAHELTLAGIRFTRQQPVKVIYKNTVIGPTLVMDLVAEQSLVLEIKAVAQIHPIHEAQLLIYLLIGGLSLGLLLNFNEVRLKDGIRRRRI